MVFSFHFFGAMGRPFTYNHPHRNSRKNISHIKKRVRNPRKHFAYRRIEHDNDSTRDNSQKPKIPKVFHISFSTRNCRRVILVYYVVFRCAFFAWLWRILCGLRDATSQTFLVSSFLPCVFSYLCFKTINPRRRIDNCHDATVFKELSHILCADGVGGMDCYS